MFQKNSLKASRMSNLQLNNEKSNKIISDFLFILDKLLKNIPSTIKNIST